MNGELRTKCLLLLEARYSQLQRAADWTQIVEEAYLAALLPLDDALGLRAVEELLREGHWVPDDGAIRQRHARLISPRPPIAEAWDEVSKNMGRYKPLPFSHRLISKTVEDLGGLNDLDHQHRFANTPLATLRAQFVKAFADREAEWDRRVVDTVQAQGAVRARQQFPALFAPWQPATPDWMCLPSSERKRIAPPPQQEPCQVPMPDELKQKLRALGFEKVGRDMPRAREEPPVETPLPRSNRRKESVAP